MEPRIKELMLEAGYAAPEIAGRAHKLVDLIIRDIASYQNSAATTLEQLKNSTMSTKLEDQPGRAGLPEIQALSGSGV